ncbi:MAG: hypothetical protein KAW17_00975 [Candidatus Eisenbacteria sp.]|nr:hypothetical protein [Candidatus Eisenbacteria bacterium]
MSPDMSNINLRSYRKSEWRVIGILTPYLSKKGSLTCLVIVSRFTPYCGVLGFNGGVNIARNQKGPVNSVFRELRGHTVT